ncbi:MAG TPA: Lrp/AsnC family transcriptional regulator [Steroidobacteraceae bacterium]|nr:Lrp/AsnC family transcriptional regulator [Steroidobacteraceae bacterium]
MSTDELDRRLLALLRKDARLPIARLSKSLGISRASVYARLQRLHRNGVIEGYTVRLNPDFDRRLIRAHVLMKVTGKLARATEKQLQAMPEIIALYAISGVYDLIAVLEAASVGDLNHLIDRIGDLEGVEKTNSSILLATKLARREGFS